MWLIGHFARHVIILEAVLRHTHREHEVWLQDNAAFGNSVTELLSPDRAIRSLTDRVWDIETFGGSAGERTLYDGSIAVLLHYRVAARIVGAVADTLLLPAARTIQIFIHGRSPMWAPAETYNADPIWCADGLLFGEDLIEAVEDIEDEGPVAALGANVGMPPEVRVITAATHALWSVAAVAAIVPPVLRRAWRLLRLVAQAALNLAHGIVHIYRLGAERRGGERMPSAVVAPREPGAAPSPPPSDIDFTDVDRFEDQRE